MSRIQALTFLALAALAGCGADGDPEPPTMNATIGVANSGRVHANGGVAVHQGPISLYLGF